MKTRRKKEEEKRRNKTKTLHKLSLVIPFIEIFILMDS